MAVTSDGGEDGRGRGRAMRARMDEGGRGRGRGSRDTKRDERIGEDGCSAAGLRVVTQSEITQKGGGYEAVVAFYILSHSPLDKVKGEVFVLQRLLYARSK